MKKLYLILFAGLLLTVFSCSKEETADSILPSGNYTVSTIPGNFSGPIGIAVDYKGNIYVSDATNRIGKITPMGEVNRSFCGTNTFGMVDGAANVAAFWSPQGLDIDAQGNIFIADWGNHSIRKVTPAGVVSTIAGKGSANPGYRDGAVGSALFNQPQDIAIDVNGNLFVADFRNDRIRRISSAGIVTTLVQESVLKEPYSIATDRAGNVFVAGYFRILKITPSGILSDITPEGMNFTPSGLAADDKGNLFFVCRMSNWIGKLSPNGTITRIAGKHGVAGLCDGSCDDAMFNNPSGIAIDNNGSLYVTDFGNQKIRKLTKE
jgi:DNA-binding beta-propeller fold protein YncE